MSATTTVITVSELNRLTRLAIEKSLPSCWVTGEISNFTRASSGHWYFTLKDEQAGVRCAFFRNRAQFMDWVPSEGIKVEVRAQATLYEPRGDYQLLIDAMRRAGQGAIYEEFLRLKLRLEAEGLFNPEKKLFPPRFPRRLGIITSIHAAALQDVLKTLALRWPSCPIIIYPTPVQGSDAATMLKNSLETAISRNECDVLLLVRGGGSLEDLYPFNDERLARAIYASPLPIITGIGHETDFTIADFTADIRAATPTAAVQMAIPDRVDIDVQIENLSARVTRSLTRKHLDLAQRLDDLTRRVVHPENTLCNAKKQVFQLTRRLALGTMNYFIHSIRTFENQNISLFANRPELNKRNLVIDKHTTAVRLAMDQNLTRQRTLLGKYRESLVQLNPDKILSRGYCIAFNQNGEALKDTRTLSIGSLVTIKLAKAVIKATVNQVAECGSEYAFSPTI
jgi:exodeoxyribonuclease VII large subunit